MESLISREAARRLRPAGPYHVAPDAQPISSTVDLVVENAPEQPEALIRDVRREIEWHVLLLPAGDKRWQATIRIPSQPTVVRYHFVFPDGTNLYETRQFEGRNKPVYGEWEQHQFQITAYDPEQMPADWSKGIIFYQIFPDRFANGDTSTDRLSHGVYGQQPLFLKWDEKPESPPRGRDFYGGDLRGVIQKLDYLAELGVDCIYFCPIFASPSNHRYDASDYLQIDPMLGTNAEFDELLEQAHQRNIKVVLDAVFNHCSSDSRYFNRGPHYGSEGVYKSKESPYYPWFTFNKWPNDYRGWIGLSHMVEFVECPEVEDFFIGENGVATYWLHKGIDGWRTDVTREVSDEFWRRFRRAVRAVNPEAYLVAEEWENASNYLAGDMYDATMNYRMSWALHGFLAHDKLTASEMDDRLQMLIRDTPGPALLNQMNLIDSHDTWRCLTTCNGDRRRFLQMVSFQLAYPGSPMIYYGDEAGIEGNYAESGRRPFPWDNIDQEFLSFYKNAIARRRESNALRYGSFESVVISDERRLYAFVRRHEGEAVYAVYNASDELAIVSIPVSEDGHWRDLLKQHSAADVQAGQLTVQIQPRGSAWYARQG